MLKRVSGVLCTSGYRSGNRLWKWHRISREPVNTAYEYVLCTPLALRLLGTPSQYFALSLPPMYIPISSFVPSRWMLMAMYNAFFITCPSFFTWYLLRWGFPFLVPKPAPKKKHGRLR